MKTKIELYRTAACLLIVVLFNSCFNSRHKIRPIDPAFAKYISGYTYGMVSRKTTIKIELSKGINEDINSNGTDFDTDSILSDSVANFNSTALPDSNLLKDIFSFKPKIKGHAVWKSNRIIEFIPDEPLLSNQFYDAEFKLKNIKEVEKYLKTFYFQFSTYPQSLSVFINGLKTYDSYNLKWEKLTGKISTSDYTDSVFIQKMLTVEQDGKKKKVHISSNDDNNEFYFYVDSIERKEKPGKVTVSWNGKPINCKSKGGKVLEIPALGDFSVTDCKIIDENDPHIELTFSDPIMYNQNLKGIITIQGIDDLTYSVDNNVVKIFPPNYIIGTKTISVSTGIKNSMGYKMNTSFSNIIEFEEPKPKVRIKGNGCILPNSNGLIFPFEAIYLNAVDIRITKIHENNIHQFLQVNDLDGGYDMARVSSKIAEKKIALDYDKKINLKQWNTFSIDLGKLISPDPGAIYRVSIKFNKKYTLCDCASDTISEENSETNENSNDDDTWYEKDWDDYDFDNGYDTWYYYNDNNASPCDDYYYKGKAVSRNILASDLGLIYKLDDNKISHAFVSNMLTAKPAAAVTVEYYDYAKQIIASGITDSNGMLDIKMKRKPFLMIAKLDKQRGYLKIGDGYANSLSKFDIEGEAVQKGVKGFIYGERGVWRPGDSLYLNFILEDKEKRLPPNHPVKFELQNPSGSVVYQTTKTKNLNGLYDFRTATTPESETGIYTAFITVGNRVFSKSIKIETIKPNRLKIYLDFKNEKENIAKLSVKWLHGAIAKSLHALVDVSISGTETKFDKFKSYIFDSPSRSYTTNSDIVFDGNMDEKGEAIIKTKLNIGNNAPGMLKTTYITKVFEEGGDFSIDRFCSQYSPYKTYVGLYVPKTNNYDNTFETGKKYKFDIVTVDEKGSLFNCKKLNIKVYKLEWRWWYEKDDEDLAQYISRAGTIVLKDTIISTTDGKSFFKFGIDYPEYGRYLITVTDLEGGHQTGKIIFVDWPFWSRGNKSNNENASMLNFSCDKESYVTNEKIKLTIPSPANGMALISIETGSKVIKKFWIATNKGETKYELTATADMSPNAYVHVTLLQPHANTINDLPIRMYGVIPVIVDNPLTHLKPEIIMSDVVKPESQAYIKVKEKNGRKMTYTLAIVDEGLLDLTKFKTPQPWTTFYAKEALGVKTWDMYDYVIGAYAGKLNKLLSIGGDGDASAGKNIKANRFKPMVKFIGPFELNAGQEKIHKVDIPNYVGSVKVMVVAENEGSYGNAEKVVYVKKPLMLLATLPRVLGPGESISLPVNIFAMENQIKDVIVNVEVNEMLTIDGNKQQSLHFNQIGDEVINFKLKAVEKIGVAKVKITATSGNEKSVQEIEIDVRTPNPKVIESFDMVIQPGKEGNTEINFKGMVGTNKATVELSCVPPIGLEKHLDYLIQYPHGCIEQTTSSAFPQLFVGNLIDLNEVNKTKISNNIKTTLKRLQLFQTSNGGFSYWPGEGFENEWGTNYAGHFIIEAEKQGYSLPYNMKQKWLKYEQQQARNWSFDNETSELIQAYRLFVLALSGNAEMAAMNRLHEEKNLSVQAKWRLAAAYKLVGQKEVALELIKGLSTNIKPYKELSYSYGSDTRDKAMILETLSLLQEKSKALTIANEITAKLSSLDWLSTQETAYCLLAMCEFLGIKDNNNEMKFSYSLINAGKKSLDNNEITCKKVMYQIKYSEKDFTGKANFLIKNNGQKVLYAKLIVENIPLIGDKSAKANGLKLKIKYKDIKGKEIQPDKIIQGTDFIAEVSVVNTANKGIYKELVLNQIFPGGWEIHNTRMDETVTANAARYQDIKDDRVYSYYELSQGETKTFSFRLNATYLGKFYLPTLYTEAMYNNTINARIPGRWIEVVK